MINKKLIKINIEEKYLKEKWNDMKMIDSEKKSPFFFCNEQNNL